MGKPAATKAAKPKAGSSSNTATASACGQQEELKPKERDEAKKEIKLLAQFHHPNIVRYRDSFLEQGVLNIVMDYAEGGDLANLLKEQHGESAWLSQ